MLTGKKFFEFNILLSVFQKSATSRSNGDSGSSENARRRFRRRQRLESDAAHHVQRSGEAQESTEGVQSEPRVGVRKRGHLPNASREADANENPGIATFMSDQRK